MIRKLGKLFPSLQLLDNFHDTPIDYKWFISEDGQIIGIHPNEISKRDSKILSIFLQPYNMNIPPLTDQEMWWSKRIHDDHNKSEKVKPFRFIYFKIKGKQVDGAAFKEALQNLYTKTIPVLWENDKEGIIIESEANAVEETIDYEKIIDVFMSDLYMNINFLVGPYFHSLKKINIHYHSMVRDAKTAFSYSNQSVITYKEAILYSMVNQIDDAFLTEVNSILLENIEHDYELLKTIKVYIQCNLNTTVAARKLHLHRNSLQYRLDKFVEKTGMNIKKFNEASVVYIMILSIMHNEK
ncbi:hypothetical protein FHP05_13500 [Cerasibacillus terrae]|uniref:PucR C-terminal helix-turn-helix domain-containing protein n=1 Tax=Cerasibacillus terrae TaxID=2498845 RepID=A0A5C8NJR1_9BACI|nr:helix-turn-helix domain-containing protein [Cerasibacillus terrae]TXL61095.1 hypothetical protein FHP05_13500 [Cerasibacillus terrae]